MKWKILLIFFLVAFMSNVNSSSFILQDKPIFSDSSGCKLIMAVGNATNGDNLLLKVRDPARPGWQVICIIPEGYEYDYHHPWLGYKMHFKVEHRFIGTTTLNDVPPNITKPGMAISRAGIAIGDADTISFLTNPSRYAWDDFDWMRYAIQSADNIDEALELLTKEAVDKLHATSVAENMFLIGINEGAIVEADAFNYCIKKIKNGIEVQSNYPKALWNKHLLYPLFTARNFNTTFSGWVEKGDVVRLGAIFGIKIQNVENDYIKVRLIPFGFSKEIEVGRGSVLGNFWIKLNGIDGGKANVFICFKYYEWENRLRKMLLEKYGNISIKDLMKMARIHSYELDGLRGMCQGGYEAATVYKISKEYHDYLSVLWFATDQCSSLFIPVHICALDIYDAYENGASHKISLKLLEKYGHGNLTEIFEKIEDDFLKDIEMAEEKARELLAKGEYDEAEYLLTLANMNIQMRAISIEKAFLNMSREEFNKLKANLQNLSIESIMNLVSDKNVRKEFEKALMLEEEFENYICYQYHQCCVS